MSVRSASLPCLLFCFLCSPSLSLSSLIVSLPFSLLQAQRQLLERRAIQQLDGEQAALEDVVAQGNDLASSAAFASLDDDEAIDGAAAADGVDGGPAVPAAEASDLSARQMQIAKPSSHIEQWTLPEVTETLSDVEEDDVADVSCRRRT